MKNKPAMDSRAFKAFYLTKIFSIIELLIKKGSLVFLCWIGYLAIKELAGKTTLASLSIVVRYIVEFKKGYVFAGFFALVSCVWAIIERELRKSQVSRFQGHIRELESRLDPNRTSSNLTVRGDTNPEDI